MPRHGSTRDNRRRCASHFVDYLERRVLLCATEWVTGGEESVEATSATASAATMSAAGVNPTRTGRSALRRSSTSA